MIIYNYGTSNVSALNNVLRSFRLHPEKIENVCKFILQQWNREIAKPIRHGHGSPHYVDNIKIALGHPNLKLLAKQAAREMLNNESVNPNSISKYLLEIVDHVVVDDKFPEWNIVQDEESIPC